jgi:regulator of replication initiation timing
MTQQKLLSNKIDKLEDRIEDLLELKMELTKSLAEKIKENAELTEEINQLNYHLSVYDKASRSPRSH